MSDVKFFREFRSNTEHQAMFTNVPPRPILGSSIDSGDSIRRIRTAMASISGPTRSQVNRINTKTINRKAIAEFFSFKADFVAKINNGNVRTATS